jgi:serine/threonine protein kinase
VHQVSPESLNMSEIYPGISDDANFTTHYELIREIGQGGMSKVFKAKDKKLECFVAIKLLQGAGLADIRMLTRLRREAVVLADLNHPNIVKIRTFGTINNQPYLVMDYLDGESLSSIVKTGPLSLDRFELLFLPALSGLAHAHERGVLHRDLKPSNFMVVRGQSELKIIDFGIAKAEMLENEPGAGGQKLTRTGALLGTPAYMSPEQLLGGALDQRSDIYSMCCVMYEALTGNSPFEQMSADGFIPMQLIGTVPMIELPALGRVGFNLGRVLRKGMSRNPEDRYQTVTDLASDVRKALAGKSDMFVAPKEEHARFRGGLKLRTLTTTLGVVVCVLLAGTLGFAAIDSPVSENKENEHRLLSASREDPEGLLREARKVYCEGNLVQARNLAKRALALIEKQNTKRKNSEFDTTGTIKLHVMEFLALDLSDLHDYQGSLRVNEEICRLTSGGERYNATHGAALSGIAHCYVGLGNYKEALTTWRKCLQYSASDKPRTVLAERGVAGALRDTRQFGEAEKHLRNSLKVLDEVNVHGGAAVLWGTNLDKPKLRGAHAIMAAEMHFELANILISLGKTQEARTELNQIFEFESDPRGRIQGAKDKAALLLKKIEENS